MERILCAANYYNDNIKHVHTAKNVEIGFLTCGRRHHNCISTFAQIMGFPYSKESLVIMNTEIQGFLTNTDRFVNRIEAAKIAFEAGQIKEQLKTLYSEDLY